MQAELSGIDFSGSDLSHAELISAILDHTNLRETNLDGVEFRQMPAIHVDGKVRALCIPPRRAGGGMMAVVTERSRYIQRWMSKGEGYEAMLPIKTNHEGSINSVSMSPDGAWIASGSLDCTVRLWRASDGRAGPVCRGHDNEVRRVAFSPTGDLIASLSDDFRGNKTYLVHRIIDGRLMREEAEAPWVKAALDEGRDTAFLASGISLRARRDGKMVYLVEENEREERAIRLWSRGREEVRLSAKGCGFFGSKGLRDNQKELLRQLGAIEEDNEGSISTTASN